MGPMSARGGDGMILNLTRAQRIAVLKLYRRDGRGLTYRAFRRTVYLTRRGWVAVECRMLVGIEADGQHTSTYKGAGKWCPREG